MARKTDQRRQTPPTRLEASACQGAVSGVARSAGRWRAGAGLLAVRATVATLRAANDTSGVGLENALGREADAQAQSYATGDFAEGVAALKEKRKPAFSGE